MIWRSTNCTLFCLIIFYNFSTTVRKCVPVTTKLNRITISLTDGELEKLGELMQASGLSASRQIAMLIRLAKKLRTDVNG